MGEGVCNFSMIFMLKPKDFTWEVENNKLKDSEKLNICRIMELIWEMSREIKKSDATLFRFEEETPTIPISMLIDGFSAIFVLY